MMWAPLGATQVRSGCTPARARAFALTPGPAAPRESSSAAKSRAASRLPEPGRAVEQVGVRGACRRVAAPRTAAACGCASRTLTGMILGVATGRLITVEGLDGAGKTTLVAGLTRELARRRARAARAARARRGRAVRAHPRAGQGPGARRRPARGGAALRRGARAARRRAAACRCSRAASGCCSTASSTPRSPTRAPGAGSASRRSARSTSSRPAGCAPDRTLLLRIDPAGGRAPHRRPRPADRLEREPPSRSSRRWPTPTTSWPPPSPSASR